MAKRVKKVLKKHAKNVRIIVNREYVALAYFFNTKGGKK